VLGDQDQVLPVSGGDRPGPRPRLERERRVGELRAEPVAHLAPRRRGHRARNHRRVTQPGGPGRLRALEPGPRRAGVLCGPLTAGRGAETGVGERDPLRQPVALAVRQEVIHHPGVPERGAVLEGEHFHLLHQAAPDHQVGKVEPAGQDLPVQHLLADEILHQPAKFAGRGPPAPLVLPAPGQPLALLRRDHDLAAAAGRALKAEPNVVVLGLIMKMHPDLSYAERPPGGGNGSERAGQRGCAFPSTV